MTAGMFLPAMSSRPVSGRGLVVRPGSGVSAWRPVGIHPRRRQKLGMPIRTHPHIPPAVVDDPVMMPAQQHHVVHVGIATISPMPDVVAMTPGRRPRTRGKSTPPVTGNQRGVDTGGDGAFGAPDPQRDTMRINQHTCDIGSTAEPTQRLRRHGITPGQLTRCHTETCRPGVFQPTPRPRSASSGTTSSRRFVTARCRRPACGSVLVSVGAHKGGQLSEQQQLGSMTVAAR